MSVDLKFCLDAKLIEECKLKPKPLAPGQTVLFTILYDQKVVINNKKNLLFETSNYCHYETKSTIGETQLLSVIVPDCLWFNDCFNNSIHYLNEDNSIIKVMRLFEVLKEISTSFYQQLFYQHKTIINFHSYSIINESLFCLQRIYSF